MRQLDRRLAVPSDDQATTPPPSSVQDYVYGAASGAILSAANLMVGPVPGGMSGVALWLGAQAGWVPGNGFVKRNRRFPHLASATAHVLWGVATGRAVARITTAVERDGDAGD